MNTAAVREIRENWVGQVIEGKFTLLQWLGGTDWSDVFLTELRGQGSQKAAIKLITSNAGDADARLAGWAEAASLSHPHLMRLFHTGRCEINGAPLLYAVMEYAEENLSQVLPERPLTASETREMLGPVLDALSFLHEEGFAHGHLKPSNIMVVDNQLKLSGDIQVTVESGKNRAARRLYDAPELGAGPIAPAADIWSLGVTLVEALTQHPPVWDKSANGKLVLPESVPQPFAAIIRECLQSDPARRCALSDIRARLEPAKERAKAFAEPVGKIEAATPPKRSLTVPIIAALVLLGVIAAVRLGFHQNKPSGPADHQPASAIANSPTESSVPAAQAAKGVVKGAVAEQVLPEVSRNARRTIRGKINVGVRATVDPSGDVSKVKLDSPKRNKYFANRARQATLRWKFKPAQVDGQAVSSVWILQFQFGKNSTEVTPVEASP